MKKTRFMVVDDETIVRESLAAWLCQDDVIVDVADCGERALELMERNVYDVLFVDIKMPGMGGFAFVEQVKKLFPTTLVVIITAYGTVDHAVQALRLGANDFVVKPFDPEGLGLLTAKLMEHKRLIEEAQYLKTEVDRIRGSVSEIVGVSQVMLDLFSTITEIGQSDSSVLILGETGTGKELIARAVHASSKRMGGPFVAINCGAIPETLIESEMFGYEKGSFTGAVRPKKGLIEVAEGGTLFLDEVGEITPKMQVDLLRVLQDKCYYRVGGVTPVHSDFRLVCATHRDLQRDVNEGRFRQDFYYRINVITLRVPPLRDRPDDIPVLAKHFLERFAREMGKEVDAFDTQAMKILTSYHWPGNIRELENVVERAVVTARKRVLSADSFSYLYISESTARVQAEVLGASLQDIEIQHIKNTLEKENWNISRSAKVLRVDRSTLYKKMKQFNIESGKKHA